ncbi:hypothetical protein O3M35_004036 [Rhynocoris fuscipes]|uniref:Scavenger receptor class B member 1 n=1 Tax=Rhynocoris fuscipes TaxID=488301 RepID=A0AAW1CKE4_9HEMI
MNTGELDIESVGQITRWNGQDKIGCWGDTDCDEITGSDGTIFPAKATKQGKTLYIYNHAMCRRIALHFNKTTMSKDGLPVQEYNVARNLFDFTNNNTDNKCYQYKGSYPQTGVFNTGPCQNDKPIYVSFPHFWLGDKQLQESIIGVNADENKHKSYFSNS